MAHEKATAKKRIVLHKPILTKTPIPKDRQEEFDRKRAAGKIKDSEPERRKVEEREPIVARRKGEIPEAGELVRKESEGGNIPADEVGDEAGKTLADFGKEILNRAFPENDPIKDIVLTVAPIGKVGAGIKAGAAIVKGVGFTKQIGRINKFGTVTKGRIPKIGGKLESTKATIYASPKANKLRKSYIMRVVKSMKNPVTAAKIGVGIMISLVGASIGGKVFGKFEGMGEASQAANIAARDAIMAGNFEAYDEIAEMRDELLRDNTFWESLQEWFPFKNVLDGLEDYRQSAIAASAVYDKIAEDERNKIETGETEDDRWKKIREEEAEADKDAVDYYNEQRKLMVAWEAEARKNQRNDDATFWRKEREKQREKEAEDRKAIADFWIEYRKTALKIREDSRPSNLNFGLL